ncbi:MAG: TatD family hydrolase [Candidatus Bathyarchaeota archaeon]
MLIDTHAHLQWNSFHKDLDQIIDRAEKVNVRNIVNIGFDLNGSRKGIELGKKHKGLYATVGIHPHNAKTLNSETLNKLRKLSEKPKVVAIGEIGLDYYRNLSSREDQKKAFEAQLCLAEECQMPVVIHDREAHTDVLDMISKFRGKIEGVMHCFSGDSQMAKQCIKHRMYLSIAGPITFPNSTRLQEIAKSLDMEKILIETDSPWLAPQPMRGKRNEPAYLPLIAEKIAELKKTSFDQIAKKTTENAKKVFNLP